MRTLGIGALAAALVMALASTAFVGFAHSNGWSGTACLVGSGLCDRPLLLLIPVFATAAWGLMLLQDD
jgi:hypothetical protein